MADNIKKDEKVTEENARPEEKNSSDSTSEGETNSSVAEEAIQTPEKSQDEQQKKIQSLKEELDESKCKANELQLAIQRLAADFDNYKKWAAKERQNIVQTATQSLIKNLLDIYESLEKAVCSENDKISSNFIDGVKLIYKEFDRILKSEGLKPIPSVGNKLDVYKHEVLMQKVDNNVPENTVLEEIQRGYLLNSFVLRPAKVVVSQISHEEELQQTEDNQNVETQKEDKGE